MLFHGAVLEFEREPDAAEVGALGRRTWELADFIVNGLGVKSWPGRYAARVALHRSCHSRGTATLESAQALLGSIAGLTLVEFGEPEQCCGFGGTFSVTFPHLSTAMGALKLEHVRAAAPDEYVSPDMSCLMHLGGMAAAEGRPIRARHIAQVLRDALKGGPRA
jgi:L-lactate dehydrogenase complex protein LldE